MSAEVGADFVLLQIIPLAPGERPPVDPTHIITRRIRSVVREIHRETHVRRAVHALKKTVHDVVRNDLEPAELLERRRVKKGWRQ